MSKRISLFCYGVKHKVCFPSLAPLGRLNVSDQKTVFTSCYVTVENILYTLYVCFAYSEPLLYSSTFA